MVFFSARRSLWRWVFGPILPSSVSIPPMGCCSLPPNSIRNAACCEAISGWLHLPKSFGRARRQTPFSPFTWGQVI
ncbi:hypothetical protein EDD18DRAFT_1168496 [Armillaria luteobubalina]|uniref:Uncharacterized protein n=1 Tax=Armillaria luteobubalina TaxID=153913 RepID=A0AA39Q6E2_9AGAR|nr:hypothetical protein EDD18DRAFT_1168496 [Armillaria luteobubalina]